MNIKTVFYLLLIISLFGCSENQKQDAKKPNIIYIYTDQQSASMMSCAGNEWFQ